MYSLSFTEIVIIIIIIIIIITTIIILNYDKLMSGLTTHYLILLSFSNSLSEVPQLSNHTHILPSEFHKYNKFLTNTKQVSLSLCQ